MKTLIHVVTWLTAGLLSAGAAAADTPAPSDFAWRATLSVPAGAHAARITLPAEAMLRLQSRNAHDVRVFNADGEAVAFALVPTSGTTSSPTAQTQRYAALALFNATGGKRPDKNSVQVQFDQNGQRGSVWVRFGDGANGAAPSEPTSSRLPMVLFDTRADKQTIDALQLQADFPANTLMHFSLASSTDLVRWSPIALKGPLFRFDGADAPNNQTLTLQQPLALEGRYLRLSWDGQAGVQVRHMVGRVATTWTPPARVRAPLAGAVAEGSTSLTWSLDFAAPLAALHLSTVRDNALIPVRVMGRNDAAQPWRLLAQTAVYRLGTPDQLSTNPPVALGDASVRWLRVEATQGMALPVADLQAALEFEPVQLVFLATGRPPFELVAGRTRSEPTAINSTVLASAMTTRLEDLPIASIASVRLQADSASESTLKRWLPAGTEQRSVALWAVLLIGVLVLGGVAYTLLRQLSAKPTPMPPGAGNDAGEDAAKP